MLPDVMRHAFDEYEAIPYPSDEFYPRPSPEVIVLARAFLNRVNWDVTPPPDFCVYGDSLCIQWKNDDETEWGVRVVVEDDGGFDVFREPIDDGELCDDVNKAIEAVKRLRPEFF